MCRWGCMNGIGIIVVSGIFCNDSLRLSSCIVVGLGITFFWRIRLGFMKGSSIGTIRTRSSILLSFSSRGGTSRVMRILKSLCILILIVCEGRMLRRIVLEVIELLLIEEMEQDVISEEIFNLVFILLCDSIVCSRVYSLMTVCSVYIINEVLIVGLVFKFIKSDLL